MAAPRNFITPYLMPEKKASRSKDDGGFFQRHKRKFAALLILLFLCIGLGFAWRAYANHRKYQELRLLASMPREKGDPKQFRKVGEQLRELPAAYRQEFFQEMGARRDLEEMRRMNAFFALNKADQQKELDRRIAEEERRAKEWEARRKKWEEDKAKKGKDDKGGGGAGKGGANSQAGGGNGNGDGGKGGPGGGGPGGGGRGGGGGNASSLSRLDRGTSDGRAMRDAYRQAMNQRRTQLGLPPQTGGRGGGGGRPGR